MDDFRNKVIFPASYIISNGAGTIKAVNSTTSNVDYSDTDISIVIQGILDNLPTNGCKIFIKKGRYGTNSFANTIKFQKSNISLVGEGIDQTIITQPNGNNKTLISFNNPSIGFPTNIGMYDLTIDGNGTNQTSGDNILVDYTDYTMLLRVKSINSYENSLRTLGPANYHIVKDCIFDRNYSANDLVMGMANNSRYIGNVITNNFGSGAFTSGGGTNVIIAHNYIHDNNGYAGISLENYGTWDRILIHDNYIYNHPNGNGINTVSNVTSSKLKNIRIADNHIYNNVIGINANEWDDSIITGNVIKNNSSYGIYSSKGHTGGSNLTISYNLIQNNSLTGITIVETNFPHIKIIGNHVELNGNHGIFLRSVINSIITGNILKNNSQTANNTYDEIQLTNWGTNYTLRNIISNNEIIDNGTNKARYGINEITGGQDHNQIINNTFNGQITSAILFTGTNTKVRNNIGFLTENSGSSTGTGVQQQIVHGLKIIPTRQHIVLCAGSATANPYHSADPDDTNIYVTATNGQTWYWATV